jgi:excinuclease UvrABC ATPase subunit
MHGAIAPWAKSSSPYYEQTLDALGKAYGFKMTEPWSDLPTRPGSHPVRHRLATDRVRL